MASTDVVAPATEVKETKEASDTKEQVPDQNPTPEMAANEKETKGAEKTEAQSSEAETAPAEDSTPSQPAVPKGCRKPNFEKDVIYLYQFARTPTLPSLSPYCLKVETWLRLVGLKYENVDHKMKYRSKKGQLPFVEVNGEEIADSAFIIKELSQRYNKDLDASLDNDQKNIAHAMVSMIENDLLWVVLWWKSKNPEKMIKGYKMNLQHFLGTRIPNRILNWIFKYNYSRKGLKKVKAQGIGVHTAEEINEFGQNDLKVLSEMLGDKPYFFGDEPTTLDVVAFTNLAQIYFVDNEIEFPLRDYMIENFPNLVGHVNRMKDRCFPDWDEICNTLDLNAHLPKPLPEEKEAKTKDEEKKSEKEGAKPEEKEKDKDKKAETENEKDKKEDEKDKKVNAEKEKIEKPKEDVAAADENKEKETEKDEKEQQPAKE